MRVLTSRVLAIAVVILLMAGCTRAVGGHGSLVVAGTDLHAIATASDAILVGTVNAEAGTRNLARDPKDPTREDPNFVGLAQDYAVTVEQALKGVVADHIVITLANKRGPRGSALMSYDHFRPLAVGSRYAFFLRSVDFAPNVYVIAFEPSRFKLDGSQAIVQSPWDEAAVHFPARNSVEFVQAVRNVISAGPPK